MIKAANLDSHTELRLILGWYCCREGTILDRSTDGKREQIVCT